MALLSAGCSFSKCRPSVAHSGFSFLSLVFSFCFLLLLLFLFSSLFLPLSFYLSFLIFSLYCVVSGICHWPLPAYLCYNFITFSPFTFALSSFPAFPMPSSIFPFNFPFLTFYFTYHCAFPFPFILILYFIIFHKISFTFPFILILYFIISHNISFTFPYAI